MILNGTQKTPIVQLSFEGSGFDGQRLFRDFWNFGAIEGRASLAVAVAAAGRNQREMIASLRGSAGVEFADGAIRGIDIASMVESVAQDILLGWSQEAGERSAFEMLRAKFKISDGIAESSDLEFLGPGLRLKGSGLADVVKGEVDFRIEPEQDAGYSGGLAMPIVVSGPWNKPKFYPDIAGILENPKAAYEALKALAGRARPEAFDDTVVKGANAGGVAGETLEGAGEEKPSQAVDLIKKQFNTNTLELMNGFTSEGPPEPVSSEQ
jgi:AsmA protein